MASVWNDEPTEIIVRGPLYRDRRPARRRRGARIRHALVVAAAVALIPVAAALIISVVWFGQNVIWGHG